MRLRNHWLLRLLTVGLGPLYLVGCVGRGVAPHGADAPRQQHDPKAGVHPPQAPSTAAGAESLAVTARSCAAAGDAEGAIASYTAALTAAPAHHCSAAWLANRGLLIAEHRGHFPSALVDLDAAVAAAPHRADIRQKRGYVHLKAADAYGRAHLQSEARDELLMALVDLDAALAADPNLPGAYEQRGTVLARLGDRPADAIADLTEARRRTSDPASQHRIDAMLATFGAVGR